MDLNTLWFIFIAFLFIGFFVLEGFDFGVGILMPFLGRDARSRETGIKTIEPFWDGNEVWLITAGGSMFAAFPHWYATLFSGFYLALVLMVLALILRGVGIEFRNKHESPRWQRTWHAVFFVGSLIPALLWGVAVGNLLRGVPIDARMNYVGGFWNLLNPFALVCGAAFLLVFTLHGALFLSLRTTGEVQRRAEKLAVLFGIPAVLAALAMVIYASAETDLFKQGGLAGLLVLAAGVLLVLSVLLAARRRCGWGFISTFSAIAALTTGLFLALFPRVMVSSLDPAWSLTIYNASSTPYTLRIMSVIAAVFLPLVCMYEAWSYWVFRKRVSSEPVEY